MTTKQRIPKEKFLTIAANLLFKVFLEPKRDASKPIFKELEKGKTVSLTNMEMEDGKVLRFELMLDHSEYKGVLNFSAFKQSLAAWISNTSELLNGEQPLSVFTEDDNPTSMIFGVTGASVAKGSEDVNVMVLGARVSSDQPSVLLRLMFIDGSQFGSDPTSDKAATTPV